MDPKPRSRFILGALLLVALWASGCGGSSRSGSGGTAFFPVPEALADSVKIVPLGEAPAAIFPASYDAPVPSQRRFTPSPELIREIEPHIQQQYRTTLVNTIVRQTNGPAHFIGEAGPRMRTPAEKERELIAHLDGWITRWAERYSQLHRQYAGYYSASGERMLSILFIDFDEDPHGWQPNLGRAWVQGWHGWYESNLRPMRYNVERNELSF